MAQNQPGDVRINIRLDPIITNSQTFSLATLGIDSRGKGNKVVDLVLENTTNTTIENLYFHLTVSTSKHGVITVLDQRNSTPFSLAPNQVIFANNNQLEEGIPGIKEKLKIFGELTPAGEDLINELEGSTQLPDAVYSVLIEVYQGANKPSGGVLLASYSESVGTRPLENIVNFILIQPGGALGSNETIVTRQPGFRWDGPAGISYRLIVVEDNGQTAESLIQAASSTNPTTGTTSSGTLLDFEMLDVVVSNTNYFYPASGAKPLVSGKRYFWQIFGRLQSGGTMEERPSEIYEFNLKAAEMAVSGELLADIIPLLVSLDPQIGTVVESMKSGGYTFESVVINGQTYSGATVMNLLTELKEKIDRGEIIIVNQ